MSGYKDIQNEQEDVPKSTFSFITKTSIGMFGYRVLFDLQSMDFLSLNKKNYPELIKSIQECEQKYQKGIITIFLFTGALALSIRRYLPSIKTKTTITIDMFLASAGLTFGAIYASNLAQQSLNKIIVELVKKKDYKMIEFIQQFENKYKVSSKHLASITAIKRSQKKQLANLIQQQIQQYKKAAEIV